VETEEEEELRAQGPGVNEVSFRARPHHNVHHTLGVAWKHALVPPLDIEIFIFEKY
jgi:hypothetical protein